MHNSLLLVDGVPDCENTTTSEVSEGATVDRDDGDVYVSRKKQKQAVKQSTSGATSSSPSPPPVGEGGGWSQKEQNQLEAAIKTVAKGTPERWQRIAECVPTKTLVSRPIPLCQSWGPSHSAPFYRCTSRHCVLFQLN